MLRSRSNPELSVNPELSATASTAIAEPAARLPSILFDPERSQVHFETYQSVITKICCILWANAQGDAILQETGLKFSRKHGVFVDGVQQHIECEGRSSRDVGFSIILNEKAFFALDNHLLGGWQAKDLPSGSSGVFKKARMLNYTTNVSGKESPLNIFGFMPLAPEFAVGMKRLKLEGLSNKDQQYCFLELEGEAKIMRQLGITHSIYLRKRSTEVRLKSNNKLPQKAGLFMTRHKMDLFQLYDALDNGRRTLAAEDLFAKFHSLLKSVETMHDKGIIHRDICFENVMEKEDQRWTVVDYGQSIQCSSRTGEALAAAGGHLGFIDPTLMIGLRKGEAVPEGYSPECYRVEKDINGNLTFYHAIPHYATLSSLGQLKFSRASDMYALGQLLVNFLSKVTPPVDTRQSRLADCQRCCINTLHTLAAQLISPTPSARPTVTEAIARTTNKEIIRILNEEQEYNTETPHILFDETYSALMFEHQRPLIQQICQSLQARAMSTKPRYRVSKFSRQYGLFMRETEEYQHFQLNNSSLRSDQVVYSIICINDSGRSRFFALSNHHLDQQTKGTYPSGGGSNVKKAREILVDFTKNADGQQIVTVRCLAPLTPEYAVSLKRLADSFQGDEREPQAKQLLDEGAPLNSMGRVAVPYINLRRDLPVRARGANRNLFQVGMITNRYEKDLFTYFNELANMRSTWSLSEHARFAVSLLKAVLVLHRAGYWHKNLCLEKIMLDENNEAHLVGTGFAKAPDPETGIAYDNLRGHLAYFPPELVSLVKKGDPAPTEDACYVCTVALGRNVQDVYMTPEMAENARHHRVPYTNKTEAYAVGRILQLFFNTCCQYPDDEADEVLEDTLTKSINSLLLRDPDQRETCEAVLPVLEAAIVAWEAAWEAEEQPLMDLEEEEEALDVDEPYAMALDGDSDTERSALYRAMDLDDDDGHKSDKEQDKSAPNSPKKHSPDNKGLRSPARLFAERRITGLEGGAQPQPQPQRFPIRRKLF